MVDRATTAEIPADIMAAAEPMLVFPEPDRDSYTQP